MLQNQLIKTKKNQISLEPKETTMVKYIGLI